MNAMRHTLLCSGLSACLSSVTPAALAAPTYQVELLPQFSADYAGAVPAAINQSGIVVGSAYLANSDSGETKALLWNEAGQISDLSPDSSIAEAFDVNSSGQVLLSRDYVYYIAHQGTLTPLVAGATNISGFALNDAGQVAGWFSTAGQQHAVLYHNGVAVDLGTLPGGTYSYAYDINNSGQVVGTSNTASGATRAVLWSNGAIVDLGTLPGYASSVARAINDAGQIVGYVTNGYPTYATRAFLWENGVMTDLGSVGENTIVSASDINNVGQIIGSARVSGVYRSTAFVWSNGTFTNLNPVIGGTTSAGCYATAISDAGQITGICDTRTYRLTPAAAAVDVGVDISTIPGYQVYQGAPLTYSILVANTGSLPASNVGIVDVMPAQMSFQSAVASQGSCTGTTTITCALGDLAVGATATVQVTVIPTATGTNINNTVTVSADGDVNAANNSATATNTVYPPLFLADVGVTVTPLQNPVPRRSNITYTITVKNNGPDTAKEVLLSDTFSNNPVTLVSYSVSRGSCSINATKTGLNCGLGDMANGATATLTVTVKPVLALAGLTYTNSAAVSTKSADRNSANNYAYSTVSVK